jgi:hypothetical protein
MADNTGNEQASKRARQNDDTSGSEVRADIAGMMPIFECLNLFCLVRVSFG